MFSLTALVALGCDSAPPPAPGAWANPDLDYARAEDVCATGRLELPVVTHYSAAAGGFAYGASDAPGLMAPAAAPGPLGTCNFYYADEYLPDVDRYPASNYADRAVSDEDAAAFVRSLCDATGVAFDLLRPDAFDDRGESLGRLQSSPGRVQILHGKVIDGSLATIILPPNWDAFAPAGTYAIAFNGFYDINHDLFEGEGRRWATLVALSGVAGRTGLIGVLWNGGGALASRTANPAAYRQFHSVIAWVADDLGGDRHRVYMSGGSRGGFTAIAMASNPYGYDYTVRFAGASVPPTDFRDNALLMSTTYPQLLFAAGWTTGLDDAWRPGWRYPACAGRPELTGMTGPQAHAYVLTGARDLDTAYAQASPVGPRFVDALRDAGTRVYLVVADKDSIVPYSTQVAYGVRLFAEELPVHADVLLRSGHGEHSAVGPIGPEPVRFNKMIEAMFPDVGLPPLPPPPQSVDFYRRDPSSGAYAPLTIPDGMYPFTMDAPAITARSDRFPIVFVGQPSTRYELSITDGGGRVAATVTGTIPDGMTATHWIDVPADFPTGWYHYGLRIAKPGMAWKTIPDTATVNGAVARVEVRDALPVVGGAAAVQWATVPGMPGPNWAWGLSEY